MSYTSLLNKEEMKEDIKQILNKLQNDSFRFRDITENEQLKFNKYAHLQRYFPAMDLLSESEFSDSDKSQKSESQELPSRFQINSWNSISEDFDKVWKTIRYDNTLQKSESVNTFNKIVHLLNPIDVIKNKYAVPTHPLLPTKKYENLQYTLDKLHSCNNQAYVDTIANYIMSRFRELNLTPHCVLYYGATTAISQKYKYNISGEYDTYRQCKWFWKGMNLHNANLLVVPPDDLSEISDEEFDFDEFKNEILKCPFENLDDDDDDSVIEINNTEINDLSENKTLVECDDLESIHSFKTDNSKQSGVYNLKRNSPKKTESGSETENSESESGNSETESDMESESDDFGIDIFLEIPNMPVIMIHQEAQEGTMDDLLDEEVIDDQLRGTQGWEARWIAWIFQVVATLTFLQKTISFTHNDLHTNNIVWRETEQKFLFYKSANGQVFRVPTYGKIFSIIDFGRSIFRLGKNLWISDDHWPNNDAGDQYNFGPFYNKDEPKVKPNESFDLCRLSVSLIDGLYDEEPPKKKGKNVNILSKEDDWVVYETNSPLYNLLWSWTVDDEGKTIYQDASGEEKYPGFDLYVAIAHNVHSAVPREQLNNAIFERFKWKNKVPKDETIYNI
jgi:hypothetical protein